MEPIKVWIGLGFGALAILVAWFANTNFPTAVTAVNDAIAEAQIVLGFFGVAIGATTIGGTALANRAGVTFDQVRAPSFIGLLGAALLAAGWVQLP